MQSTTDHHQRCTTTAATAATATAASSSTARRTIMAMGNIDCMTASTSSSIARRAAVVNNEGTALLQSGRYHDAVRAFGSVLTILKPFIPGNGTSANSNMNNTHNHSHSHNHNHSVIGTTTHNPADVVADLTDSNHAAASANTIPSNGNGNGNVNGRTGGCQEKRPVPTASNDHQDDTAARAAKRKRAHGINNSSQQQQQQQQSSSSSAATTTTNTYSTSLSHAEAAVAAVTANNTASKDRHVSVDSRGNANKGKQDEGEEHFVFQDPIEIPLDVVPRRSAPSKKLITKFVVVVMYNLALAVHLSAEHAPLQEEIHFCDGYDCDCDGDVDMLVSSYDDEERRRIMLARAQRLYELAFQMHLEESCDVTLLYSLALMNNLGLIYRMTGDVDRSQRCFNNQLSTMMYLLEAQEARTIKQWDGLFSNVMNFVLKDQREISAPAA